MAIINTPTREQVIAARKAIRMMPEFGHLTVDQQRIMWRQSSAILRAAKRLQLRRSANYPCFPGDAA